MRIRFSLFISLAALALPILGACSNETEGQPCDINSGGSPPGTNDCESPLLCQQVTVAAGPRCCPQNLSQATTVECSVSTGAGVDASPAPPDGSGDAPRADATETSLATDAGESGPLTEAGDGAPLDIVEAGATPDATDSSQE